MLKSIDEPKLYGKYTVTELKEKLEKLAKSHNEFLDLLKQVKEWLEKD